MYDTSKETDMNLTVSQRQAILSDSKRIVVVACPGSGKTTVLTRRIHRLIDEGVSPKKIYAITFTNKAAEELKVRLKDSREGKKVVTSTFHGFALRVIRDFGGNLGIPQNFTIYDEQDRSDIIDSILVETGRKKHFTKKAIGVAIREWLDTGTLFEKDMFRPVLEEYLGRLKTYNGMDFDVLILEAIRCLEECPGASRHYRELYDHFLIDEAQDMDYRQYDLIKLIVPTSAFFVADIDQCIYEWRSAKPDIIMNLIGDRVCSEPKHKVVRLEESHRCPDPVAKVANHVISKNENRYEKSIKTDKEGPEVKWLGFENYWNEASFIWDYVESLVEKGAEPKEVFVLARTKRQLFNLSKEYHSRSERPFEIEDLLFHSSMWSADSVRAIINSLKLLVNSGSQYAAVKSVFVKGKDIQNLITKSLFNETSLFKEMRSLDSAMDAFYEDYDGKHDVFDAVMYLANYSSPVLKDIGLTSQDKIAWHFVDYLRDVWCPDRDSASIEGFLDWYSVKSIQDYVDFDSDKIKLMTVHASKGLEAEVVIVAGVDKGVFPSSRSPIEEERRLFYVAITRAKNRLVICYSRMEPSVFVEDRHGAATVVTFMTN